MVKKKTIHEELFERFNINPEELSFDQPLKLITKQMKKEIIETLIQKLCNGQEYKITDRRIVIPFANQYEAEEFSKRISEEMIRHINQYLRDKKINPKEYYRVIDITTSINGSIVEMVF